jgi:multidrug efflux pump subunit AcrB
MKWIDLFIQRPVLTWMVTLSLIVFGLLGFSRLGVDQFPDMEFPMVRVMATMEGASPEVMEQDVTDVLEEELNTISGVRKLTSTSTQGSSAISVEFNLDVELDSAAQDVRDRVARSLRRLPQAVDPPVVDKVNMSGFPIMWIPLMTDRPQVEASEFVKNNVKPKIETVPGVAGIDIFGERDRAIRIWLDGEALRGRGLAVVDVIGALNREHVERPGGIVEGGLIEYSVKTDAEYRTIAELEEMVVAFEDGAPVHLADVARVEDGAADVRFHSRYDGQAAVGVGVVKQSDGNTVAVADEVLRRISVMQKQLPEDMTFKEGEGVADFSRSIREAVEEAIFSLWFGAILATLVVFFFLRRFRPTLVVALAIPISLIATFGVMWTLDYTLNTMTILALTLTPMLAARIPAPKERPHGSIYHLFDRILDGLQSRYRTVLLWTLAHRMSTLGIAALSFFVALAMGSQLGTEFFPKSDEGRFFVSVTTPPGTSPDGTLEMILRNEEWILAQPEVAGLFAGAGSGGSTSGNDPTRGVMFVMLKSKRDRERHVHQIIAEARKTIGQIPGQKVKISDMSGFGGSTSNGEFTVRLQGNVELDQLNELADRLIGALESSGGYVDLDKSLKLGTPEVRVIPDRAKAAALGVDAEQLAATVQAMIGGLDVATFKEAGNRYDIRIRLDQEDRSDPAAIEGLYVRTRTGEAVELRNLVRIEMGAAPSAITRADRQRSVTVSANLEGKDLGTALAEAQAIADEMLPEEVQLVAAGGAEEFIEGFAQLGTAMGLAILVIYMILAAQFESLVHPLTVMLALLGGLYVMGMTLNIFSLIGIILLFGLVTKNSILLVDYANQLRGEGMDKVKAMVTAAPIRMRPVLMTALSMIFGVAPAALGLGPGSESRAPMAVATGAGMISSTLLTLLVVPTFYLVVDDTVEWIQRKQRRSGPETPGRPEPDAGTSPKPKRSAAPA